MTKQNLLSLFVGILSILFVLPSCRVKSPKVNYPYQSTNIIQNTTRLSQNMDNLPKLTLEQKEANEHLRKFASCLMLELIKNDQGKNILLSPFGISSILNLLANGANEQAAQEITNKMGSDLQTLNSFFYLFGRLMPDCDKQVIFSSSNSIWFNPVLTPSQAFADTIKKYFNTEVFVRQLSTKKTQKEINNWCKLQTHHMIPTFLSEPLDENINMFIANAIFFNGEWTVPFDRKDNTWEIFKCFLNNEKRVEMMHGDEGIFYSRKSNGYLISIPYGNKTYKFNIFLPNENISLEEVLMDGKCLISTKDERCKVIMPKFDLTYEFKNIDKICKELGIDALFEANALSKISPKLSCGNISQKARIELNETGTKASAITTAGAFQEFLPPTIIVNRPFIFSITATDIDIVLFMGCIYNLG